MKRLSHDDLSPDGRYACSRCLLGCDVIVDRGTDIHGRIDQHDVMSDCCEAPIISVDDAERELEDRAMADEVAMEEDFKEM